MLPDHTMPARTEFVSFAIKPGMESDGEAWMRLLIERQPECVATLDGERMHYESIFRSVRDGRLHLSWFSVRSAGGRHVTVSSHEIDRLHVQYWERCVDRTVDREVFEHVVSFVPATVAAAVSARSA